MSETFTYNSVDLTVTPYFVTLMSVEKAFLGTPRVSKRSKGSEGGTVTMGGAQDELTISTVFSVEAAGRPAVLSALDSLHFLVDTKTRRSLLIGRWPDRYYMVRPEGDLAEELGGGDGDSFEILSIDWLAPDPSPYSTTEQDYPQVALVSSPQDIMVAASYVENATADTKPAFVLQASAALPAGFTLANVTLGTSLTFVDPVANGHYVRIDSDAATVETSPDSSTWNYSTAFRSETFPVLSPRVANTLRVTGCASGTLDFSFRERFKA